MLNNTDIPNKSSSDLSADELQNPKLLISQFFQNYTLPECRALLRETLHQALSGYGIRDGIHPADLLSFLEELEKATEAMYIVGSQNLAKHSEVISISPKVPKHKEDKPLEKY